MRTPTRIAAAALVAGLGVSALGVGSALASSSAGPAAKPVKAASPHERSSRDRSRELAGHERSSRDRARTLEKSIDRSKGSRAETSSARDW